MTKISLHGSRRQTLVFKSVEGGFAAAGYAMEPTGSDAASKNGRVEWTNGTFGGTVPCLLYSAGLSAFLVGRTAP
jgi:hypothetical protein